MKVFLSVCVLFAILTTTLAAQAIIPKDTTPGHPGHCNSDTTGPLKKSEVKNLEGKCTQAFCSASGNIVIQTCGAVASPCKREIDYALPYPKCCEPLEKPCDEA